MPKPLIDNHGRTINYLRLAVTDRCNLRCFYCMPEEGIKYVPRQELLTYEEMIRIIRLAVEMGISKLRITGGEPFVRKGIMEFIRNITSFEGLKQIHMTTNGTLTKARIPELVDLGISSVNLSLDTLDADRFYQITRRNEFDKVMDTLETLIKSPIKVKINMVVMNGKNIDDIIPMIELSKKEEISVRFIEEMPFNGSGAAKEQNPWNYTTILDHIQTHFGQVIKLKDPKYSTSLNYQVKNANGSFGIIPAYSRTFCGTCNRLRITPQGILKTCLYDSGVFDLKAFIRNGATDEQIKEAIVEAVNHRDLNGFEAERNRFKGLPIYESMSTIGG